MQVKDSSVPPLVRPRLSHEWIRMAPSHDLLFWVLAAIQLLGVFTCVVTRLVESTRAAASCQMVFVASLLVMGGATMAAMYCGSICWISCGSTLSIMVVGATLDFRGNMEPSPF